MKNILILCTGNSARSIIGEALFNWLGRHRLRAYSAGSHPAGTPHPQALRLLSDRGFNTSLFRSKSWDEFASSKAPVLDIVITVCDAASKETCPVWNTGSAKGPVVGHWGIPDPASVTGEHQAQAFEDTYETLREKISKLMALDFEQFHHDELRFQLKEIGMRNLSNDQLVQSISL